MMKIDLGQTIQVLADVGVIAGMSANAPMEEFCRFIGEDVRGLIPYFEAAMGGEIPIVSFDAGRPAIRHFLAGLSSRIRA